jgi:hypothetical protein
VLRSDTKRAPQLNGMDWLGRWPSIKTIVVPAEGMPCDHPAYALLCVALPL